MCRENCANSGAFQTSRSDFRKGVFYLLCCVRVLFVITVVLFLVVDLNYPRFVIVQPLVVPFYRILHCRIVLEFLDERVLGIIMCLGELRGYIDNIAD